MKPTVKYCEATVIVDGERQACDQILDERGQCPYARDHEDE